MSGNGRRAMPADPVPMISFDEFLRMLRGSSVSSVTFLPDDVLEVVTSSAQRVSTRVIKGLSSEWLVERLVDSGAPFFEGRRQPSSFAKKVRGTALVLMPLIYLWLAYMMLKKLTDESNSSLSEKEKNRRNPRKSKTAISWEQVAGIDSARRELQEVVDFVRSPERFRRIGARCPRGVLLSGPPGCGKTLLARAAAHEAGINIIVCSASDFVEVFVGRGAARVRDLFKRAESCAPCILFFDELDALAKSRTGGGFGNDEREQTLNQLLTEMDGFDSSGVWDTDNSPAGRGKVGGGGPVIVIAATNRPDVLDSALLRPGRFDRHVRVQLPDEAGRLAILLVHLERQQVPLAPEVSLGDVAAGTPGFSGAELGNVVNEACLLAIREGRELVAQVDLVAAMEKVREANAAAQHYATFSSCG